MSAAEEESIQFDVVPPKRSAYDPNNLDPIDEEARKYEDMWEDVDWEDIDWDEIIATTQDDVEAGRFAFDSADYATDEEAMAAFWKFLVSIAEEVERESKSAPPIHTTSP